MRKAVIIALAVAFIATFSISIASADTMIPLAYSNVDQSVMGPRTSGEAFRTQMQIGASARQHTAALDQASGAGRSYSNAGNGGGADFQFGSSQHSQSWKAAKTVEEAQVHGLVPNDCQGENSDDAYRRQMNQSRDGFAVENLVSQAQCSAIHTTNNSNVSKTTPNPPKS